MPRYYGKTYFKLEGLLLPNLISVIAPVFNEAEVLHTFYTRICEVFNAEPNYQFELLFVNDGSRDDSQRIIEQLANQDSRVAYILFSRNFGKEVAMTAGFDHASGDAVIVIDTDLQDPPELIHDFIREWQNGYDMVYAKRTKRDGESWVKKATAALFYRIIQRISRVQIPEDTGDYRLLSRRAVAALQKLREHHRFMKGLFAWIGFPSKAIEYRRAPRAAGVTKFNYWKLWNFALEGITSFTVAPLTIATYMGLLIAAFAFCDGAWIITKTLIWGVPVDGYPTLLVTMLFLGGTQLFFIGVLGEYLGRIFGETKQRPLYIVQEIRLRGPAQNDEENA